MPKLLPLVHITHIYIGAKLQDLLDLTLKGGGSAMSDSLGRLEPSQEFTPIGRKWVEISSTLYVPSLGLRSRRERWPI